MTSVSNGALTRYYVALTELGCSVLQARRQFPWWCGNNRPHAGLVDPSRSPSLSFMRLAPVLLSVRVSAASSAGVVVRRLVLSSLLRPCSTAEQPESVPGPEQAAASDQWAAVDSSSPPAD